MLHTISQSPYQNTDLSICMVVAQAGDDILFYQDAVIAMQKGSELNSIVSELTEQGLTIYVLTEDCELRGIHVVLPQVAKIDYAGFVKLVEKHEAMYGW